MTTLTATTQFSDSWIIVHNWLKSVMVDPKNVEGEENKNRKWIYREQPNVTARNFQGYPYIMVDTFGVEDMSEGRSFSNKLVGREFNVLIQIKSAKFTRTDPDKTNELDTLSDQLLTSLDQETVLTSSGLKNAQLGGVTKEVIVEEGEEVLVRNFPISFERFFVVNG